LKQRLRQVWRAFTVGDPWLAAVCAILIAYYSATRGIFQGKASGDGYFGFMYLPGIFYHHTLDLAATLPSWAKILGHEVTGRVANPCPIGTVPFWAPFYLVGRALEWAARHFVKLPSESLPGQTEFDYWMAGLGSLVAALLGLAATYRLIARRLGVGAARFATALAALATPLAWYAVTQPLYQHACAFFLVALLVERWDAWRGEMTWRRWALLGVIGGAAMLTRLQDAVFLLLPGLDAASDALTALREKRWNDLKRAFSGGAILSIVSFAIFLPQVWIWYWFFGSIRTPQPPGHMRWIDPALVAMTFSLRGGLLPWTPIYYLVIPGLIWARKRLNGLSWRIGVLLAIELWVNAAAWDHWGSWAFGARRFVDAGVVFAVGIGAAWAWAAQRRMRVWKGILCAIGIFAVGWNFLLMELLRNNRIKSSSSRAFPSSTWVKWANGPQWLGKIFDRIGYPFCQPEGWIFSAVYRVPPRVFEGVVGNHVMERDCRIHSVVYATGIDFATPEEFVVEGIAGAPIGKPPAAVVPVEKRVRMLIPMFAREPVRAKLSGEFHGREREARIAWNGAVLAILDGKAGRGEISVEVPREIVHSRSRMNEVVLTLPEGTLLRRFELQSTSVWW